MTEGVITGRRQEVVAVAAKRVDATRDARSIKVLVAREVTPILSEKGARWIRG